jgi:hypothetical protein
MWNSTNKDWVNSKNAINEIGCIHSVQGYDLNYAGVIIGSEFIMRKGKLLVNKEEYKDVKGRFDIQDTEQLKIYIRNIYKVLLTRGIRGTFLYVCDEELREYFRKYIPVAPKNKYYDETESQYLKVAEGKENKNRS